MKPFRKENARGRRSEGERAAATAREERPVPGQRVRREAPANAVYLDPDLEHGRARIVIMLSEDKTIIEPPLRINMSEAQYASIMAQQAEIVANDMVERVILYERNLSSLAAEVEFLRAQIAKGTPPPASGTVPEPFPQRANPPGLAVVQ